MTLLKTIGGWVLAFAFLAALTIEYKAVQEPYKQTPESIERALGWKPNR